MVDMVLEMLPKVAAEIAAPLSKASIKMVSGPNGELGAGKITSEILKIISDIPNAVKSLTGVDMSQVSSSVPWLARWPATAARLSCSCVPCGNTSIMHLRCHTAVSQAMQVTRSSA